MWPLTNVAFSFATQSTQEELEELLQKLDRNPLLSPLPKPSRRTKGPLSLGNSVTETTFAL